MEENQLHEKLKSREKIFTNKWISAKYSDNPEGKDLFGKLYYVSKFTASIGASLGSLYAVNQREKIPFSAKCVKFSRIFFPFVGLGVAFTCVTYYSVIWREKDDEVNYFIGGAVAGSLIGLFSGRLATGVFGAFFGSLLGGSKKILQMHNMEMFGPRISRNNGPYITRTWDLSLTSPRNGNWTK